MGVHAFSGARTQTCRLPMRPFPACPLRAVLSLKRSIFLRISPRTAFFSNQSRTPNSHGPSCLSDLRRVFRLWEVCQPFAANRHFKMADSREFQAFCAPRTCLLAQSRFAGIPQGTVFCGGGAEALLRNLQKMGTAPPPAGGFLSMCPSGRGGRAPLKRAAFCKAPFIAP